MFKYYKINTERYVAIDHDLHSGYFVNVRTGIRYDFHDPGLSLVLSIRDDEFPQLSKDDIKKALLVGRL